MFIDFVCRNIIHLLFFATNTLHVYVTDMEDGIFFLSTSTPNSSRQLFINKTWGYSLKKNYDNHELAFITGSSGVINGYKNGAKYFLEKTKKKWYWVIGDDVFLDLNNIENLIHELNSKYDTERDPVEIGYCFYHLRVPYLQGGSGFILSRYAAKKFIEMGSKFINEITTFEDVQLYELTKKLEITSQETACPYMFGHISLLNISDLEIINECPKYVPFTLCYGHQLFNIQNLTLLHYSDIDKFPPMINLIMNLKKNHPDIMFYYYKSIIRFCRQKT